MIYSLFPWTISNNRPWICLSLIRYQVTHVSNPKISARTLPFTYYIPTTFTCHCTIGWLWCYIVLFPISIDLSAPSHTTMLELLLPTQSSFIFYCHVVSLYLCATITCRYLILNFPYYYPQLHVAVALLHYYSSLYSQLFVLIISRSYHFLRYAHFKASDRRPMLLFSDFECVHPLSCACP